MLRRHPARRLAFSSPPNTSRCRCLRPLGNRAQLTTAISRPSLPFLSVPTSRPVPVRYFTSERANWLRHEAKQVVRYTLVFWTGILCVGVIVFAIGEEMRERDYPTPHEWRYLTRKFLRDANDFKNPKDGLVNWPRALEFAREVVVRLEVADNGGGKVVKLSDKQVSTLDADGEFIACDVSAMSEEWRRGYFEAVMLGAKAAEHVDGWVRDKKRSIISPPEFVIGPSNPRPSPIPAGFSHAPREEDCELAYPAADEWYMKILATKGFTSRQKIEAALEYASFMEYKKRPEGPDALYNLALAEATQGTDASKLPYDTRTFVLKEGTGSPSLNVLDAITAIANHKARGGDLAAALPIYVSVLKARRSLSDEPPPVPRDRPKQVPVYRQILNFFAPPDYPPPPPDGTLPPWRSPNERCQEAALNLYIGEILYATSSQDDGLAWTRDGVDAAEEQLRKIGPQTTDKSAKQSCRECLSTGLGNWATMVASLAREEAAKAEQGKASSPNVFNFWSAPREAEDRWAAEELVVKERMKRTQELLEDVAPPASGLTGFFKA
ncbi:hypothetical protein HJFPF1_01848 [Paramyrothecium foliicola]|nr:hypothetical protein HJFPF1_01848 [Paramyrothecium foliicola]